MTFAATVNLTSAAHKLNSSQYFRLYTKRLLTDFTEPLEETAFSEDLQDIISELKGQSGLSWYQLKVIVQQLAKCQCTRLSGVSVTSHNGGKDGLFTEKLTAFLLPPGNQWPTQREDGITLRHLLVGIYHIGSVHRFAWCDNHNERIPDIVGPNQFRFHCRTVETMDAIGLCLDCTRKLEDGTAHCKCSVNGTALSKESDCVRGDSYLLGTGAAS